MPQKGSEKIRRIKQISVKDLFGIFHHVIPLNMDERITIIHGPNGFGKTIILRLLNDLFSHRNSTLRAIPFSEFRVEFENGMRFLLTKASNGSKSKEVKQSYPKITFHTNRSDVQEPYTLKNSPQLSKTLLQREIFPLIERWVPELDRIGPDIWRSDLTYEVLRFEEVLERFGERLPFTTTEVSFNEKEPDWLSEIRNSVALRFIETQRLLNPAKARRRADNEGQMKPTVKEYSEDLAENIKSTLAQSAALSQSLDSTFPSRVVNFTARRSLPEQTLLSRLEELEDKRARLTKVGLLEQESSDVQYQEIDDRTRLILSVYVEDVEKKLAVFDEIANKIDLLARIINKRFSYKQIAINKERGFIFTTSNGAVLSPTDLSSGEQHELVLFYELLFKVAPGSLILIDEPELSLHVAWQMEFLKDLKEIADLADLDVLIATHSPQIIHDRWDLTVRLEGPEK